MLIFEIINVDKTVESFGQKLLPRLKNDSSSNFDNPADFIQYIASDIDPTPNQKYAIWLIRTYLKGGINRFEDFDRAREYLELFHKFKNRLPIKDINQIKTLSDLGEMVLKLTDEKTGKEAKKAQEQELLDSNQAKIIYNSDDFKITLLNSVEASCYYGKNTQWCTASTKSTNYFDDYNKSGNLYVLLNKKKNQRWQIYMEPNGWREAPELRDENDREISFLELIDTFPPMLEIFGKKFENQYFNFIQFDKYPIFIAISKKSPKIKYFVGKNSLKLLPDGTSIMRNLDKLRKILPKLKPIFERPKMKSSTISNVLKAISLPILEPITMKIPPKTVRTGEGFSQPIKVGIEHLPKATQAAANRNLMNWFDRAKTKGLKLKKVEITWNNIQAMLVPVNARRGSFGGYRWNYIVNGKDKKGNKYIYWYDQGGNVESGRGYFGVLLVGDTKYKTTKQRR